MNDFRTIYAFRLTNNELKDIENPDLVEENELLEIDKQKKLAKRNVEMFLNNKPFLNMLLWGERGCGKSSLIKMLLHSYKDKKLRVVELRQNNPEDILSLYEILRKADEYKFLLLFDDISFDKQDAGYRSFKSSLEGSIEEVPQNIMFAATSNKRHLIKDEISQTDSIYAPDEINEQMSLYGRFGLVLGFYSLSKNGYLNIVKHYMAKYGIDIYNKLETDAEVYAMSRGGRSGRIAKQFAVYKLITGGD